MEVLKDFSASAGSGAPPRRAGTLLNHAEEGNMPPLGGEAGSKPAPLQPWPQADCIAQARALWKRGEATVMGENCWGGKCANPFPPPATQVTLMDASKMPQIAIPLPRGPFALCKKDKEQPKKKVLGTEGKSSPAR